MKLKNNRCVCVCIAREPTVITAKNKRERKRWGRKRKKKGKEGGRKEEGRKETEGEEDEGKEEREGGRK